MPAKKRASSSNKLNPEDIKVFKDLFWKARKSHAKKRKNATEADPEHQQAVDFAKKNGWAWAETLLKGLLLTYRDEDPSAYDLIKGLEIPDSFTGEFYFVKGNTLCDLKEWDAAIDYFKKIVESCSESNYVGCALRYIGLICLKKRDFNNAVEFYKKAINSPGFDVSGDFWNEVGFAYLGLMRFDQAIECYKNAIGVADFDQVGNALSYIALSYSGKRDFDQAVKYYQEAIAVLGDEIPGNLWRDMGLACLGKMDFDQAIELYKRAINTPGFEDFGGAWSSIGLSYYTKRDFEEAIKCYKIALQDEGYGHDNKLTTRIYLAIALRDSHRISEAEAEINKVLEESDSQEVLDKASYVLATIVQAKKGFEIETDDDDLSAPFPDDLKDEPEGRMYRQLRDRKTRYEEYVKDYKDKTKDQGITPDGLNILRGWSSSVTLLEGAQDHQWAGGGYFFRWQGKGLVLDPGFDFLDNFHQAGFHVLDIDAVVASHNHPDHNADLKTLDDLCYEIARVANPTPKFLFAMDEDTQFPDNSPKHRGSPYKFRRYDFEKGNWLKDDRLPQITIEHFPVKHTADVPHALGFRFRLLDSDEKCVLNIGYTGDGEYTDDLAAQMKDLDLLIAHVSQPKAKELYNPNNKDIEAKDAKELREKLLLKQTHLGYNGVIELIKKTKPKLVLIGEFWAGLADMRLNLIDGIRRRTGNHAVLPACLGLHLSLPDLTIPCMNCKQPTPAAEIRISPPQKEFGPLGYHCKDCIL